MHTRKTGALIRAAATLGALGAGADARTIAAVDDYARELGLAFQIVDDVLDVEGSTASLGKTAGKDAAAGKPTFPAIHGLDGLARARRRLHRPRHRRARGGRSRGPAHGDRASGRSPPRVTAAAASVYRIIGLSRHRSIGLSIIGDIGHRSARARMSMPVSMTDDR